MCVPNTSHSTCFHKSHECMHSQILHLTLSTPFLPFSPSQSLLYPCLHPLTFSHTCAAPARVRGCVSYLRKSLFWFIIPEGEFVIVGTSCHGQRHGRRSWKLADHLFSTYRSKRETRKWSEAMNPKACWQWCTSSSKASPPTGPVNFANRATNCQPSVQTHCQRKTFLILNTKKDFHISSRISLLCGLFLSYSNTKPGKKVFQEAQMLRLGFLFTASLG